MRGAARSCCSWRGIAVGVQQLNRTSDGTICCSWRGIAVGVQLERLDDLIILAVAGGESPLGYNLLDWLRARLAAVAGGESPLGYNNHH